MKFPIIWENYVIRFHIISDAKGMKKFFDELVDENADINKNNKDSLEDYTKKINNSINDKNRVTLCVFDKNKQIGECSIGKFNGKCSHRASYFIAVSKDYRKKGIGKKLSELTIELAKKNLKGIKILELEVFKRNVSAIKLYKKMGFKKFGEMKDSLESDGKYYDSVFMYLRL